MRISKASPRRLKTVFRTRLGILLAAIVLSPGLSQAQRGQATVNGTITDQSGATLPDTQVTATNTQTGQTSRVSAGSDGTFVIPLLPVGTYSLEFAHAGFKSELRTGLILTADQIAAVNVSMSVGSVTQTAEVRANAEMLQTTSAALGQVVSERAIVDLPLNGRNPASLVLLSPGTVNLLSTPAGNNHANLSDPNDTGPSANGGRQGSVYFLLDGVNNMDNENLLGSPMPNPDATQEFRMVQNNFDSQYGFAPNAVVSIVTRSGTNSWHGDAFEFLRNYALNGADFFTHQKDTLKRNQFGGSIGGPIKRDKIFIFGSYQQTPVSEQLAGQSAYVPTNQELSGNFSGLLTGKSSNPCGANGPSNLNFDTGQLFYASAQNPYGSSIVCPATSAKAGQTVLVKQPIAGNIISPRLFNPVALRVEHNLPKTDAADGLVYLPGVPANNTTDEFTVRSDYNISDNHRLFARVFYQDFRLPPQPANGDLLAAQSSWDALYTNYAIGHVWTITPNLVNNLVGAINLTHVKSYPGMLGVDGKPVSYQLYGSNVVSPPASVSPPAIQQLSTNGFNISEDTNAPMNRRNISVSDSLTWVKGKHIVVGGIDVLRFDYTDTSDWQAQPRMSFDGEVTGNDVADFLLGYPNFFEQGGGELTQNHWVAWQPYIQDSIRVKPNFTLNLGVRWEPYFPATLVDGRGASFRPGQQSTVYPNAPLGLVFPGDKGVNDSTMKSDVSNFSPRIGLAWQPHFLPNTSVRAGFGIFVAPIANTNYHHIADIAPFSPVTDLYYNQIGLINMSDPWASWAPSGYKSPYPPFAIEGGPKPASNFVFSTPVTVSEVFDPNFTLPKDQSWNVSIQHQFTPNTLVTVAYVGSETYHLGNPQEVNPGVYAAGGQRAAYLDFASILMEKSWATSSYNGLQISFEKRFSQNFQFTSNYTYSKCLDEGSYGDASFTSPVGNPYSLEWNRGLCDFDFPHVWVNNWVWQLPSLSNSRTFLKTVAGGWQATGIWTFQSGMPFSISGGCNGSNNSEAEIGGDRADTTGEPLNVHQGSQSHWLQQYFNTGAFTCNAPGTFGSSGRNIIFGPGTNNADIGVFKNFPIKERYRVQFRWEMFNTLNHPHFSNPGTNPVQGGFGQIVSLASPQRIMQGALKLYF